MPAPLVEFASLWSVRVVAVDLRDTLVKPPRADKLFRAMTAVGVPDEIARLADREATNVISSTLNGREDVLDWKLAELYEAFRVARRSGVDIRGPMFEVAFNLICEEYIRGCEPLVDSDVLGRALTALKALDCAFVVVTDGPHHREAAALANSYPDLQSLDLFTSGDAGVNKFSSRFYRSLAAARGVDVATLVVIGNREDKDVRPAVDAGCNAILIGRGSTSDVECWPSFAHLLS